MEVQEYRTESSEYDTGMMYSTKFLEYRHRSGMQISSYLLPQNIVHHHNVKAA
ncbi:hypothetical protein J6590_007524 [Homalodisca vitripennis]|nr:hypothetical protein J6590_007524 [Homalodisca vitripennis]